MSFSTLTLLGSSGGVGRALLALLNKSAGEANAPLYSFLRDCHLHLIDLNQKELNDVYTQYPNLRGKITLHSFNLTDTEKFRQHLIETRTQLVVDASWADTCEILECCDELGIRYTNTALENIMVDENDVEYAGFTVLERWNIFEEQRNRFSNTTAIMCSGMNPGIVQWAVLELMKQTPDEKPHACYIVERDSSFLADHSLATDDTVYISWAPECFLDEVILNYPMFVRQHVPLVSYNRVMDYEYPITLGLIQFNGFLMAHEEVISLGKLLDMEIGFLYRVNDHTINWIRANREDEDKLWDSKHKLLDPQENKIIGEDLVGVLLVYENKERFMYNVQHNTAVFDQYQTSATYFQVASGLYAAICSLLLDELPKGIFWVDELLLQTNSKYGQYVTYHLNEWVTGENNNTDGLLLDRRIARKE